MGNIFSPPRSFPPPPGPSPSVVLSDTSSNINLRTRAGTSNISLNRQLLTPVYGVQSNMMAYGQQPMMMCYGQQVPYMQGSFTSLPQGNAMYGVPPSRVSPYVFFKVGC